MSHKFDSMMKILNRINSGSTVTRASLAEDLGITTRTVDRYIDTLRAADFPVAFDKERGTYCFEPGFRLGETALSAEEALVLGLARNLLERFGKRSGTVLDGIMRKAGGRCSALPAHIVLPADTMPPQVEEHIQALDRAILELRQVRLDYCPANSNGRKACRVVNPHYLFFQGSMWYLRAFCRERKEPRVFALDRIEALEALEEHFVPDPGLDPAVELEHTIGAMIDGDPVEVVIRFSGETLPYLSRHRITPDQTEQVLDDGRVEVRATVNGLMGVKRWLYRFIPHVQVVAPDALVKAMRDDLERALESCRG